MELNNLERGKEYMSRDYGRVLLVGEHPFDGACLICETCFDADEDELHFVRLEASELTPAEGPEQWPYLGFQTKPTSEQP